METSPFLSDCRIAGTGTRVRRNLQTCAGADRRRHSPNGRNEGTLLARARVELAAQANVIESEQRLRQVQEGAALDVQQAVAQLEEAISAWQASQGTADQATRAYSIAEVRFREGISTQLELSETRVQLQQALANRARAARDLQVARVRLQLIRDLPIGAGGGFGGAGGGAAGSAGSAGGMAAPAGQQQGTQRSGTNMQSGNLP